MLPSIYLVDDDAAFLDSLTRLVESMDLIARPFNSSKAFLEAFDPAAPGCVILDLRMPEIDGLALQRHLAAMKPAPVVIILTGHAEVGNAMRAVKQGATEFLQKQALSETELWEAIQRGLNKNQTLRTLHAREKEVSKRAARLTATEREVLDRILIGESNLAIASALGVSRRTVENRRARLMRKVGVATLADLIAFAIEAGMIAKTTQ